MTPGTRVGELHVLPHERSGAWLVGVEDGGPPLSWHDTAGEAESAAKRHAALRGDGRIFVHDRYRRVRPIRTPARPSAAAGPHPTSIVPR